MNALKQMIQFNKTAFDNTFNALEMARQQNEELILEFLDKSPQTPAEGKKAIKDWLSACKKSTKELKSQMDKAYDQVEEFLDQQ